MTADLNHKEHGRKELGLYLGLLTHRNSKYPKAPFLDLFRKTFDIGKLLNFDVSNSIIEENPYSAKDVALIDLILARLYEPLLHRNWSSYLANEKIRRFNKNNLRIAFDSLHYYKMLFKSDFRTAERIRYSRILNINSGYTNLLNDFLSSGKIFGLIFEDDAFFETSSELINEIFKLLKHAASLNIKSFFIDISDSFTFEELGVEHLVETNVHEEKFETFFGSTIRKASVPFSNTTCAVIYNREMALHLHKGVRNLSTKRGKRITPMDWSFNLVLMDMAKANIPLQCFHLDPGMFTQSSLKHINQE